TSMAKQTKKDVAGNPAGTTAATAAAEPFATPARGVPAKPNDAAIALRKQYECGPVPLPTDPDAWFERHLVLDHLVDREWASMRQRFQALGRALKDLLAQRWLKTRQTYFQENPKRVYYLSMEFLIGRSLTNNILNLMVDPFVKDIMQREGLDLMALAETEPDAGLGNGGLGRLAACYIDSMATMQIPAHGYGLRYQYGIFRQEIKNGWQVESPDNWLRRPDPWETVRYRDTVEIQIAAGVKVQQGVPQLVPNHATSLLGIPFDRPVVGYGGKTINSLRLWEASSPDFFDLGEFNHGDFFGAMHDKVMAENLTRVLYPDDSTTAGRRLRFGQEFFLVACSLADIIRRFRRSNADWHALPDKVAIQLNDTHPALSVAELMRILLDEAHLNWEDAWDLTVRTLAYTNHTLLPEALEKWPVDLFELVLPRHLEIIYEVNRRFLADVQARYPGDEKRLQRMSVIEESPVRQVRMANLAIVGTHSTNGVAAIHTELLRTCTVKDFAEMFPERFSNKTNGVTPRRWLLLANPPLARLITEAIGDSWITDLAQLCKMVPLAEDKTFHANFRKATREAKVHFVDWLKKTTGKSVDPDTLFDSQIKRIHEYKRQLLNVLHIIILYNRLRANTKLNMP
ncbi:MAG TPA: glycogen/starch/alpha-glucan family phosphorylase, partial [Gemmataceae bacterium]